MDRLCIIGGCKEIAGTEFSPYFCPKHDAERLAILDQQFEIVEREMIKKDAGWNVEIFKSVKGK